jgi:hypothetical protein
MIIYATLLSFSFVLSGCDTKSVSEKKNRRSRMTQQAKQSQAKEVWQTWDSEQIDLNSLADTEKYVAPTAEGVVAFEKISNEYIARINGLTQELSKGDPNCPPTDIKLEGIEGKVRINRDNVFAKGSGSYLYLSMPDEKYIVKHIFKNKIGSIQTLAYDYAFLKVFQRQHIVPDLFDIEPGSMPEACRVRLMVTEFAGKEIIRDLSQEADLTKRMRLVASVGARALELLREVHQQGLIHGDVHFKNFVYRGPRVEAAKTLRLIDFGRAAPFLTPDGKHVLYEEKDYQKDKTWRLWHLSPWELRKIRKTRRDDIFRLAESLIRSGHYDGAFNKAFSKLRETVPDDSSPDFRGLVFELKVKRKFNNVVPQIFIEFYKDSLELNYDARPDYESWIEKFRTVAKGDPYP